jgi:hypothetical protein
MYEPLDGALPQGKPHFSLMSLLAKEQNAVAGPFITDVSTNKLSNLAPTLSMASRSF